MAESRDAAHRRDFTRELVFDTTAWFVTVKMAAQSYAAGMRYHMDEIDWPTVNSAIIERWSKNALTTVKREARKINEAWAHA